jgi:hypothetical protein
MALLPLKVPVEPGFGVHGALMCFPRPTVVRRTTKSTGG